jgi:hypothetical protein
VDRRMKPLCRKWFQGAPLGEAAALLSSGA